MAQLKYLVDSNTLIDYIAEKLPEKTETWIDSIIDEEVCLSIINKLEVLGFNFKNPEDIIPFEELIQIVKIFSLDEAIENKTIELRKTVKIKLPDAIIAATALVHGLTIVSHNLKDFSRIAGLAVIDPHKPLRI